MKKVTSAKFSKKQETVRRRRIGNSFPMPKGDPKVGQALLNKLNDCLS